MAFQDPGFRGSLLPTSWAYPRPPQAHEHVVSRKMGRKDADNEDNKVCSDPKYQKKKSVPSFRSRGIHKRLAKVDIKTWGHKNLSEKYYEKKRDKDVKVTRRGRARKEENEVNGRGNTRTPTPPTDH